MFRGIAVIQRLRNRREIVLFYNAVQLYAKTAVNKIKTIALKTASIMAAGAPEVESNPIILEEGVRCPPFRDENGGV